MLKVLWLAPNFNHYKARFLNHLANENGIELAILSGTGRANMGDQELEGDWSFKLEKLNVTKKDFGNSNQVKEHLKLIFKEFDWILIPAEKKNLSLFSFALKLRKQNTSVRLFSYNHAQLKSKNILHSFLDRSLTKFYNKKLDRVIFYTEDACKQAIKHKLIAPNKAFWANNTVDNIEIDKYYTYTLPPEDQLTLLFIGRLIPSKRISDTIDYYKRLKQRFPKLKLEIIGDGPENTIVKSAIQVDSNIIWHETLVDEAKITPIMTRASLVFIPGLSGLSINHAFSYGRPYVTLEADKHGPEISYLQHGENGYILKDDVDENIETLSNLLKNKTLLHRFCTNAKEKGIYLSVQNWVEQIKSSLLHE
ncbi:glycosyltransferase family 4 protein [uncultured Psychroserpens sp.]|uniref:glycosyltransferase family 4 protein n=1 Tax=uncultured Psychroserpens sp. TaxID=255436 RepID=UPI0026163936|nr:glycosyltransferase family 4 protein [uncultured Psychroserpens sp.]